MSEPRRIRVIGKQHPEPDLKALARAVIELARLLDESSDSSEEDTDGQEDET